MAIILDSASSVSGSNPDPATIDEEGLEDGSLEENRLDVGQNDSVVGADRLLPITTDKVIPVYSTVDDDPGLPVAYSIIIDGEELQEVRTMEGTEEQFSEVDYLGNIDTNIVDGLLVLVAVIASCVGYMLGRDLLGIWLQS